MKTARPRHSLRRTLLLSAVVAVSFLSASALAADSTSSSTSTTTSKATTTTSTSKSTTSTTSSTSSSSMSESSSSSSTTSSTTTTTSSSTSSSASSSSTSSSISSSSGTAIPVYPAPTVPPTENAPFMQQSTMPDGTVFIAVGAILGTFALAVLIWRGIVAYLLHRSIARAALAQHAANDKAAFPPPNKTFYKNADHHVRESLYGAHIANAGMGGYDGAGLGGGTSSGRGVRRTQRGATPSATPSQTNLFFSPTAPGASGMGGAGLGGMAAGMSGMGASGMGNRDSRYLPSGFYAAGSGSPAAAGTPSPGPSANMSNLNLRPDSRGTGYGRVGGAGGMTPPESPAFGARSTPVNNVSHSSINLTALQRPASGRAPSAFLDDLLDENPSMFPPGGPQHDHSPGRM